MLNRLLVNTTSCVPEDILPVKTELEIKITTDDDSAM